MPSRPVGFTRTPGISSSAPRAVGYEVAAFQPEPEPAPVVVQPHAAPVPLGRPAARQPSFEQRHAAPQPVRGPPKAAAHAPPTVPQPPADVEQPWHLRVGCDLPFDATAGSGPATQKVNVEMAFAAGPPQTTADLVCAIESTLVADWDMDGTARPPTVTHVLLWDRYAGCWEYLHDVRRLASGDQLYVLQPDMGGYLEAPLPPPRRRVWAGDASVLLRDTGSVRAAADVGGRKVNVELSYGEALPASLDDFTRDVERVLTSEASRAGSCSDVCVSHFMLWSDEMRQWELLRSARQLADGVQVYAAQRECADTEGPLPEPLVAVPGGAMLTRCWGLYRRIDASGAGRVTAEQLGAALASCGIHFPPQNQADLFRQLDADGDGSLCFAEFASMGLLYPSIVNYLDFMSSEFQQYWKQRAAFLKREQQNSAGLDALHSHELALRRERAALMRERDQLFH
eukprot:TRINITY_DN15722_c0_g1_i2.p2 TRINITY_DN15722_c0_g1~~TRINITY_DN15722_c0_g1_i2.p2  ORF type:complete len:480 (+),score=168.35 TRINITY_DN15722_c0_g1_i2:73-1440(+)